MGLTTIAEGVESAETMAFLADAGCKLAQGYYCGVPMDAASASLIVGGRAVRQPAA